MASNGNKLGAFQNDIHASGLDRKRCQINAMPGVYKASSSSSIMAGQMVGFNASHELVLADGTASNVFGVAAMNQVSLGKAVVVDEVHVVAASGVSSLKYANVSNVAVRTAVNQGGTLVTATGDFTLSAANGTLTWEASPAQVSDGQTVYVTYTYDLTESMYQFQGKNFYNSVNDVSFADGRLSVILAPSIIFTTQFDTSKSYSLTGAGASLFLGGTTSGLEGLFTNDSGEGAYVGHVISLPSADDPFLGVHFTNTREEV